MIKQQDVSKLRPTPTPPGVLVFVKKKNLRNKLHWSYIEVHLLGLLQGKNTPRVAVRLAENISDKPQNYFIDTDHYSKVIATIVPRHSQDQVSIKPCTEMKK